jgi:hypothetical protein
MASIVFWNKELDEVINEVMMEVATPTKIVWCLIMNFSIKHIKGHGENTLNC